MRRTSAVRNRVSGIYAIVNTANGRRYVGSTSDRAQRRRDHWFRLRRNMHGNPHLQNAWNKYGEACFEYVWLETVAVERLLDVEQNYINGNVDGYNIAKDAQAAGRGIQQSRETIEKRMAKIRGRPKPPFTPEHRANISRAQLGKKLTDEHKAKVAATSRGRHWGSHSVESKAKISAAGRGRKTSDATKALLSAKAKAQWGRMAATMLDLQRQGRERLRQHQTVT